MVKPADVWSFRLLGVDIGVQCTDSELLALVKANWGSTATVAPQPDVMYSITRINSGDGILVTRSGAAPLMTANTGEFMYDLEKDLTMELQRRRSDLFFLHAAAAEVRGRACLLVAESGQGKSTTVWALLHHGFGYLSDELAPIDLSSMQVQAYPHALCLKRPGPAPYSSLPSGTLSTSHTLHVPIDFLPRVAQLESYSLATIFFLSYVPSAAHPVIRSISTGEASARLYANALNQLAHPNAGLDAAVHIAQSVPCFRLDAAELSSTCTLIAATFNDVSDEVNGDPETPRRYSTSN